MTDRATSKLGIRVAWTVAAFAASIALAGCAAHFYETPHLSGSPETPIWIERDVLCALGSSAVALAVGASARRWVTRAGAVAAGSAWLRGALWALFSLLLLAVWGHYLFLLSFVVAPSQAFAASRLLALVSSWRSELR